MLAPLNETERKAFRGMVDVLRTWVQDGYIREVSVRYGETLPANAQGRRRNTG